MSESPASFDADRSNNDATPLDVVAVAPHPDDVEFLCGGTLASLVQQGYRVGIFDMTNGEPTPRGSEETRAAEAEAARQVLGVHVRLMLGMPNRVLMDSPENRMILATALRQYRPRVVIGPLGRTVAASPDHYQGQLIVEAARFYSQLTKWDDRFGQTPPFKVPHLVYAPVGEHAEPALFRSSFCVDISAHIETKLAALKCYESQFDAERFATVEHYVRSRAANHGASLGVAYAEFFALPRPLLVHDVMQVFADAADVARQPPGPA